MDAERFEVLAQAYGADLRRWPAEAREPARALLAAFPGLQSVLAEADALDAALDAWRVEAPPALRDKVLAAAPKPRRRGFGLGLWLSGAGFAAAATAAGAVAGVALFNAATYGDRADGLLSAAYNADGSAGVSAFTVGAAGGRSA
jgi:hypothetical protein